MEDAPGTESFVAVAVDAGDVAAEVAAPPPVAKKEEWISALDLGVFLPALPSTGVSFSIEEGGNADEIAEGDTVMQSKEICFPFPTLRAATHISATSSRPMRVPPVLFSLEVLFLG